MAYKFAQMTYGCRIILKTDIADFGSPACPAYFVPPGRLLDHQIQLTNVVGAISGPVRFGQGRVQDLRQGREQDDR